MTLSQFRKLLQGCNPEAELTFVVIDGTQFNCVVASVVEWNPDDKDESTPRLLVQLVGKGDDNDG